MSSSASIPPTVIHCFAVSLPEWFKINLRRTRCAALTTFGHATRVASISRRPLTINVSLLAATAALRHAGTPYAGTELAIIMEKVLWAGWLGERPDGFLMIKQHQVGHAGRLTDCAASLGEALSLCLAETLFGYSVQLFHRVAETDPQGMDFLASTPQGNVALEAKGRGRWATKGARAEIRDQFAKRLNAQQKYGFILLYQQGMAKARRKSYVQLVDPPGIEEAPDPRSMHTGVLEHYYQISLSIGLWPLAVILAERLGRRLPEVRVPADVVERVRREPNRFPGHRITIGRRAYVGRFFDPLTMLVGRPATHRDRMLVPSTFFYGLDLDIVSLLMTPPPGELERLLEYSRQRLGGFAFVRMGEFGPIRYAGLSDGVLRVDLAHPGQPTEEGLDISPNMPHDMEGMF